MQDHARDKDTAAWLAHEYGGDESKSLFVVRAGSPESTEWPWANVQRRIAQLIKADQFYTPEEYDRLDDIDPIAVREALSERGIVDGKLVDPDALAADPTSEEALTAVNELVSENERLTAANQTLTNDLAASRKAYRERFLKGNDPGPGGTDPEGAEGNPATIESLFKKS